MNKFIPNAITKAYLQKVDDTVAVLRLHISRSRNFLSYIFDDQFFDNADILYTGCRVWVRWLNDTDLEVETNQQFVNMDASREGLRGARFWKLLGNDNVLPLNGNPPSSTDALKYFALLGPEAGIFAKVLNFLDTEQITQEQKQNGYDLVVKEISDIIKIFSEFLNVYKQEYAKQFPEVFTPSDSGSGSGNLGETPTNQTPVNSANVTRSITDFIKNNQLVIALGIGGVLSYQILKNRNNA